MLFIVECALSNLVLVLNCKFGDLVLKTKERLTGKKEEKREGKKTSQVISHLKTLFLWNHNISPKSGDCVHWQSKKYVSLSLPILTLVLCICILGNILQDKFFFSFFLKNLYKMSLFEKQNFDFFSFYLIWFQVKVSVQLGWKFNFQRSSNI